MDIKTIENSIKSEMVEKKSKFITEIFYIESREEAEHLILKVKKKYYDAKHICYAFCVMENQKKYSKMSDDGEPNNTAGLPILSVIEKNHLSNILVIVIRYFGGILLGVGGLRRAYSNSCIIALNKGKVIYKEFGIEVKMEIDYVDIEEFKYYCNKNNIKIINMEYNEKIFCTIELNEEKFEEMLKNKKAKNKNSCFNILSYVIMCRKYLQKVE